MMNINTYGSNQNAGTVDMRTNHVKSPLFLLIAGIGLLLTNAIPVWAYDATNTVNFNVTGTIEEPVCAVTVKPSSAIDLGTVSSQYLTDKPGATSDATAVALVFDNCSTGTASVTITFNGASFDSTYTAIYENELIDGAKGVGLQLLSAEDQKTLGPNDSYTYVFNDSSSGHTFDMNARMYTPYGRITAGNVAYTVTFNVSYK
ncbi:MAG: fimbrial protein [Klebsiella huaxiensis]|uniref:fimbrial protein n=1 Tax=Klebsiella huaxiensis TaxID=2153354 RepID=UPI0026EE8C97|nr:fimbrial protein [Klebsiella huaxiensis]WEJ88760.1 MAG: fimbrial protein [Klebsiella huaxiensis]